MSGSHCHTVLTVALLLPPSAVHFASTVRQDIHRDSAALTIKPTEATIHVGEKQIFKAVVKGIRITRMRWAVQESNGGQITEHGIYTAPRHVGLYHVVATSEENPGTKAVAKVTVVTEYYTPDWLRQPKP